MRHYTRDDVDLHSDGFRDRNPAVNVKVHGSMHYAFPAYIREESPDPRFTLEWIEENMTDEDVDSYFWSACESRVPRGMARTASSRTIASPSSVRGAPGDGSPFSACRTSRSGTPFGWLVGASFADGIPIQMLGSIYLNAFEAWADEQDDGAAYNDAAPIELALACR